MYGTLGPWRLLRVLALASSICLYPVSMHQRLAYSATSSSGSLVANAMYFSHGSYYSILY